MSAEPVESVESAEPSRLTRVSEAEAEASPASAKAATAKVATSSSAASPRPEAEDTDIMLTVGAVTKLRRTEHGEEKSPGCAEEWRPERSAFT
jgi:hypothetical protein